MKGTALLIAVLVMAAANADAQPKALLWNVTPAAGSSMELAVRADARPTMFMPNDRAMRLMATGTRPTMPLWSVSAIQPVVAAVAQSTVIARNLAPADGTMQLAVIAGARSAASLVNWNVTPAPAQFAASASGLGAMMFKHHFDVHLNRGSVDWVGLFHDQLRLDGIMHFKRMTEPKTVREVYGQKHFAGYVEAVKGYLTTGGRWDDGDSFLVNDVSHPYMGSLSSRIYTNNDRRCKDIEFGDRGYWPCMERATAYAVFASANWEWNPLLSESAIGFVGRSYKLVNGKYQGEGGWSDFVMTPLGGMGVRIAGDIATRKLWPVLDRHLSGNGFAKALNVALKVATNPTRALDRALNLDFKGAVSTPARFGR